MMRITVSTPGQAGSVQAISLTAKAVSYEGNAQQGVTHADELVAERRSARQLRHDLSDAEADCKGRESRPPPREVRALARETGPPCGIDHIRQRLLRTHASESIEPAGTDAVSIR